MARKRYLALDLGAESGRGVVGAFDGEKVTLEEVHRFSNGPTRMGETLYWDLPHLVSELHTAIGKAAQGGAISSMGVDTWGRFRWRERRPPPRFPSSLSPVTT